MIIKLLQLNIFKGLFLDQIIDYVKKEQFDICTFQEVTGGLASYDKKTDCFQTLKNLFALTGILTINVRFQEDQDSYLGNATFFNSKLNLQKQETIWLKPYTTLPYLPNNDLRWETVSRSVLFTEFKLEDRSFFVINTHGAWGPKAVDTLEKTRQGQILYNHINKLAKPFILAGDFNLTIDSKILQKYDTIAINLTREFSIRNTLNPRIHSAKELLPKGIAVDHIFISPGIKVSKFKVIDDIDLSDHLGLVCEFEL